MVQLPPALQTVDLTVSFSGNVKAVTTSPLDKVVQLTASKKTVLG